MKVLFLPFNIASMQAITCEALNQVNGVEAKCINIRPNKYTSDNSAVIYLQEAQFKKKRPVSSFIKYLRYRKTIKEWIRWADVVHYVWGPALKNGADVKFARKLNKAVFIEWVGSDIRNPDILSAINPFYKRALGEGYEYRDIEMGRHKYYVQELFSKAGAIPTLLPEMSLFLDKKLFPSHVKCLHRLNIGNYIPQYPSIVNRKPLIIHSPSVKIGKGSNIILKIIEELKDNYEFDFMLVHDKSRDEALQLMQKADIFVDQIIVGAYGMATCEAMAFGKPVVNYVLPEVFAAGFPTDCPIVNSNPENLKEQLIKLINDSSLRNEIGKKSRLFVEKYNNADLIAHNFVEMYRSAIQNKKYSA